MRRLHLCLVLPLLLASCGESDPKLLTDQATEALQSSRWAESLSGFDNALKHMEPGHAQYVRASLGRCTAKAHTDPEGAKEDFLKLAEAHKERVTLTDFHVLISEFVKTGRYDLATDLVAAAQKRFPGEGQLTTIGNSIADAAKRAGDHQAMDRLKSLGYVGGDR